jgi:hypothetical protein
VSGGGATYFQGQISAGGKLGSVHVVGDLNGGAGQASGEIQGGSIKNITIDGNVTNGSGFQSASILSTSGDIGSVVIGGDVDTHSSSAQFQISAAGSIGSIKARNLIGFDSGNPTSSSFISARNVIGAITVVDSASFFRILAGYGTDLSAANSEAQIGKVVIGTTGQGNVQGVDIVAGALSDSSGNAFGQFGDGNDAHIGATGPKLAGIASVIIKGKVIETSNPDDSHGIVAGVVGAVKVSGHSLPLTPANDFLPVTPSTETGTDMYVVELGVDPYNSFIAPPNFGAP